MKLSLGVTDLPYTHAQGTSTGQVAKWLENKYHVMELFYELHEQEIANAFGQAYEKSLENALLGAPQVSPNLQPALDAIRKKFNDFITQKQLDSLGIPGVPTKASLQGVDHRKKSKRGSPGRPSFRDTGLYLASFVAWLEQP